MTGSIEMQANGDHGICIGGGVSSCETPIKLLGGNIRMSSAGKDCIGAGSYDGSCGIETGNATVDISCSGDNSVALGSLCGYVDIKINGTKLMLRSSANVQAVSVHFQRSTTIPLKDRYP